jgi:aminopeptidase N
MVRLYLKSLILVVVLYLPLSAQLFHPKKIFTQADSLRGGLSLQRSCYDVTFYVLDIKIDPHNKFISGSNRIEFRVVQSFDVMQIDLFENMEIEKILFENFPLKFVREYNAVFVYFPEKLSEDQYQSVQVYFSGYPQVAKNPPWDGGFIWKKDSQDNPWVSVTTQGTGASLWWPNKDHQSDKPDSVLLRVTVPPGLEDISNGRLRKVQELANGWSCFHWFISYPINNYNITINIGKFAHFSDVYKGENELTLDYYVLPENLKKARRQFKQVKSTLSCFEKFFGPYPFSRDGYKLIESSHLGMEHQTAVAYGNGYRNGYKGNSSAQIGLKFDYIIIHESAHEWWGNSITSKDIADLWIHESFATYAEALYVECRWGYHAAMAYLEGKKQEVRNDQPIIGPIGVNQEGSADMYAKGALMLNTLRHILEDDKKWFSWIKNIAQLYKYQTVETEDIIHFFSIQSGRDLGKFFEQYLQHNTIPTLDISLVKNGKNLICTYRWISDVPEFDIPIKITIKKNRYEFIYPSSQYQKLVLKNMHPEDFKIAEKQFYVNVNIRKQYVVGNTD